MKIICDLNGKQTSIEFDNEEEQFVYIQQQEEKKRADKEARTDELRKMFAAHNVSYDKHIEKIEYYNKYINTKYDSSIFNPFKNLQEFYLKNNCTFDEYIEHLRIERFRYGSRFSSSGRKIRKALTDLMWDLYSCPLHQSLPIDFQP